MFQPLVKKEMTDDLSYNINSVGNSSVREVSRITKQETLSRIEQMFLVLQLKWLSVQNIFINTFFRPISSINWYTNNCTAAQFVLAKIIIIIIFNDTETLTIKNYHSPV